MSQCRSALAIGLGLIGAAACLPIVAHGSPTATAALGPPLTNETPLGYRIDLTIDPAEPRFTGHVEIDFKLQQPSRLIHLDSKDLNVTHVEVRTGAKVVSATYRQIDPEGHAEVALAATIPAGAAVLTFDYDAPMEEGPSALFHAEVNGEWFAWTELEGNHSRRVFPCFDQLNFKTPFAVSLTVPHDMIALSAMPELEHHRMGDRERHVFAPSPPLPTYLVSFAVGPFVSVTGTVPPNAQRKQPLPLRVFAPRGEAPKLGYTLTQTAAIIGLLEDLTGVPFPYPKIDQIGSSLMKGGMENAGAVVYGDDQLFPGDKGSLRQQRSFGILVSHELAHQWFGDFVTPLWWDDIWLKESFATWAAQTVTPHWQHGDVAAESQFLGVFGDMGMDELPGQKAMRQPVDEAQSKLGYFFSYGKGSQILSMAEAYMGPERFRAGVHAFLTAHANASATASDLFSALGDAAGSPTVTKAMHTFTDQPGVPLLDIRREGDTMIVHQSRYAPIGTTVKPELWIIPFCYRVGGERRCTLLDKETTKISLSLALKHSAPVMPNADGKGYYRFNLSDDDWTRLVAEGERMPLAEGMMLDDSLWSAFRSGHVSATALISALHRLAANPRPEIALDGGNRWMQLDDLGFIPQESLPAYRAMLAQTYAPMLAKLGFDPTAARYDSEDVTRRQLRADLVNVLALGARQPDVLATLNQATDRFLAGDAKALDPAFWTVAFKARVRDGGPAAAETLLAKAVADQDGVIHTLAIMALGENDDPGVAAWLIGKLGHSGLRLFDEMDLVQSMLRYAATQNLALGWLRANYARIAAMHIGRSWGPYLAMDICSAEGAADIEHLMRPSAPSNTSEGFALDRVLETIKACAALRAARSGDIAQALNASHDASEPTALDAIPKAYRIGLTVNPAETRFTGHVEIDVDLTTPRQVIHLGGRDLSVTRIAAKSAGQTLPGTYQQLDDAGHAKIDFESPLPAGRVTLTFDYSAPFQNGPGGLFRAQVDGDWYVWSELFPNPRRGFPSFDQPNALAPMTVSITTPQGMTVVSNAPEEATVPQGTLIRHDFSTTPPMQTGLFALAVGPFASESTQVAPNAVRNRPLPLRILAPRSQAGKLSFALAQSSAILQQLEDYLQSPFPYAKLDELASPLEKGGLSASGDVLFGSDMFLLDPQSSVRQKQSFAKLVSHELSHQWFGNLLMADGWGETWMEEAFANFVGPEVVSRWKPEWAQPTFAAYHDMDSDMLPGQPPVYQHLTEDRALLAYRFAYGKGSQILAMLNTYLGDQPLRNGIRTFIDRHRFQTVTTADLIQDMAAGSGDPIVARILDSYVNQPGLPLLSLRRQGKILQVTQSPDAHLWTIPFCYRQNEHKACAILSKQSTSITLAHAEPVVPNVSGSGYYRFDMPNKDWSALVELLPRLPAGDALAINDSLWSAFGLGSVDARRLVDAMQAMARSREPSVVLDSANRWTELRNQDRVPDQAYADYRAVLRKTFSPVATALGAEPESGRYATEDPKRQLLRAGLIQTLVVEGHDEQLTQRLSRAAGKYLAGDEYALDPAFLNAALTAYLRVGQQEATATLLKAAVADQGGRNRPLMIRTLGAVDDPTIATWIISQLGQTGLRPADEMDLVQEMLSHPRSRDIALPWVLENYQRLAALGINRGWGPGVFWSLCSTDEADKVQTLFAADGNKGGEMANEGIKSIRACAARKAGAADIARALHASL